MINHRHFLHVAAAALAALLLAPGLQAASIILTSDQQLRDLQDPDKKIDMSTGYTPVHRSLREVCEAARERGDKTLTVAFDEFFRQYRPQAGTDRKLTPDMDEYVEMIGFIGDFAKKYGMGLCLSLMSPLELGPAFKNYTGGESGRWLSYGVGFRNPESGRFNLDIWQQLTWTNNKGKVHLELKGIKAYAFRQKRLGGAPFIAVNPDDIIEIPGVTYEAGDVVDGGEVGEHGIKNSPDDMIFPVRRLHVTGDGTEGIPADFNRVLVVVEYATPEIDYFSPRAKQFLHDLLDKYKKRGIVLNSFYSDEMHIQQDWIYFQHQENGQLNFRFLTPAMSKAYKDRFGQDLDDKYMLYFAYGAPYFENTVMAVRNVQYVMGEKPADIHRTFLLRDRYYKMLNWDVVDLFKDGKAYAEQLYGHEFPTGAHASWAESPTIDRWDTEKLNYHPYQYEYTPNFVWSNTVHQASAACYDYFKWGEYLEPTGNDFAECGWGDRDYYGAAMGTSLGVVNRIPNAYAAAWGFPAAANRWKNTLNEAYGANPGAQMTLLTDRVHRDVEVLMVYPMNLVAVEERFGSWMTQYGYANYLTSEKLVEMGKVTSEGQMQVAAKQYGTIAVMFEPLPSKGLLDLLARFAEAGGKVLWFSAPPLLDGEGKDCSAQWDALFGVKYGRDIYMGEMAPGKTVEFTLPGVDPQVILTDFLVDHVYPVASADDVEQVALVDGKVVGTHRKAGKGDAWYFGFRARDDQSRSLGYETNTLFQLLRAVGAYPATGRFAENDNPVVVSRTTDFFASKFPNGATALVKHYRTHRELWPGGFSRNKEADDAALAKNPLPSDALDIKDLPVNGHRITYQGKRNVAFNTSADGRLCAFYGCEGRAITVDGTEYVLSDRPVNVAFGPVKGDAAKYRVWADRPCRLTLPLPAGAKKVTVKNGKTTVKGAALTDGNLAVTVDDGLSGKWLDVTVKY